VRQCYSAGMLARNFEELVVWQKAHALTLSIYSMVAVFPKIELFGLTLQIKRSAVSVPSNIAEGFKRKSRKEAMHFYNISEGSLEELRYQMLLAKDLKYISDQEYKTVHYLSKEVGKLLTAWKKSQKIQPDC
jgi:four helix bundle protein